MPVAIILTRPAPGEVPKEVRRVPVASFEAMPEVSRNNPDKLVQFEALHWATNLYFLNGKQVDQDNGYRPRPGLEVVELGILVFEDYQ